MEAVTGAIMSALIPKLGELLKDEYNLDRHVRKGVKSLQTELMMMHAALRKVARVPRDQLDEQVRIWAGEVRDLSYDMEDSVDDFLVRVLESQDCQPTHMGRVMKVLSMIKGLFIKGKDVHQISKAITEAQDLAKELMEQRQRYELDMPRTSTVATIDPRMLALYKDGSELVGVDPIRDEVIKKLIDEDGVSNEEQNLKTISIVGIGGLGKTTLAKAVHDKIQAQFDCVAFVPVGQNPDLKKLLKDIFYGLDKQKFKDIHDTTKDEKLLIDQLGEFLMDKRYLIIIDDIWEEKMWRHIKCGLSKNNLRSRVIITTRKVSVSEACHSSCDDIIHKMEPLSDQDSQILFYRRIFQSENVCPHELEEVSRDILKKCGGIPLAITTIASLLVNKCQIMQKDDWLHLLNSMGHGVTEDAILEEMKGILLLSYYDLPSHLKTCFLYLSIFPRDFEIERDCLIWRWVAEGFIQRDKVNSRLFEIGECYFSELMNRSLIQPERINEEGMVETCRIHDMVLDLACSLSSEENFVCILDNAEWHTPNLQRKVRRLSLHNSHHFDSTSLSKVRSFLVFSLTSCDWLPSLSNFHFLHVLDLGHCGSHGSSSGISVKNVGNLLHLRYLGLRGADVDQLPVDIGKLQLLQTLYIGGTRIQELPASVVQLRQLIFLCVYEGTRLPKRMGNLTSLEVLERVRLSLSPHIVEELGYLTEIRTLTVDCYEINEDMFNILVESLGNLRKLQNLQIWYVGRLLDLMREGWMPPAILRSFESWSRGDMFLRLPQWIDPASLPLLSSLVIGVEELHGDDIQIMGMLPALRSLRVRALRVTGRLVVRASAFPSARECKFFGFPISPCLFPPGAMPGVQRLVFRISARLVTRGEVDCSMRHLPSLERVDVHVSRDDGDDCDDEYAKVALRRAADEHPKRPAIHMC